MDGKEVMKGKMKRKYHHHYRFYNRNLSSKGHINVVDVLVQNKADINRSAGDGSTALWIAASNGHGEVIRILQKAGADLNTPNQDGTTPLFAAEAGGNEEAANVLKEFGAKG